MSNNVLLSVNGVVGGYARGIDIIRGLTIDIRQGEICCIIGPNGAGKSTLLRLIYGLLIPKSGNIVFDGESITACPHSERLRRGICYVPQGRCNFPMMTIRENLEMGAFTRKDKYINRDIDALMERFPILTRRKNVLAGNLSGGEQQCLEMAMAMMLAPRLLLLDEPSLGLAPIMVREILEQIKLINAEGVTVVLVEQNARQGLRVADHGVAIALGCKRYEGTGAELLANEEVARLFLGG